jgi:hypothetical protein
LLSIATIDPSEKDAAFWGAGKTKLILVVRAPNAFS